MNKLNVQKNVLASEKIYGVLMWLQTEAIKQICLLKGLSLSII